MYDNEISWEKRGEFCSFESKSYFNILNIKVSLGQDTVKQNVKRQRKFIYIFWFKWWKRMYVNVIERGMEFVYFE